MAVLKEFKEFAVKGNALDMAVGIIIGAAFGTVVQSLVRDVLTPPLGLLLGDTDFSDLFVTLSQGTTPGPYPTLAAAQEAGAVTVNYGVFVNGVLAFVLVAFAVFFVVRSFNRMRQKMERATEENVPDAEEPVEPPPQERLLREIRDLLREGT